jgi:hypothetical protein
MANPVLLGAQARSRHGLRALALLKSKLLNSEKYARRP